ncbi:MAG: 2-oxoglutarate dehydrogenase complex dihydrolipoyllysine-residue succinyltransferase [Parachlamydiaceae bacterium]|nr:2-oxoglutarate dehydrogenase complex dihydrolipoyllysine-residue succinyltransferase [Parachlamydiaceae bacterium]
MKQEVKVPRMGESISEATVSAILKPAGSSVQMDDELLELATDKVNQVLYAQQAGIFTPTVKEDDIVKIDQVVGYIESNGKSEAKVETKADIKSETKAEAKTEKPSAQAKASPEAEPTSKTQGKKAATESVKEANGIRQTSKEFIEEIKNSKNVGDSSAPVQASKAESTKTTQLDIVLEPSAVKGEPRETRSKMSRIRKVIATRLVEVQQSAAMLTTFNEVDMTAIMALREKYKETFVKQYGVRLGFMSFFVKAAVAALRTFPSVNSYIDGDEIVHREYYDIGIAVGTDKGLMVPIVRSCDQLSFAQIEKTIVNYATKVKEGTLTADDLQGGGFTITNGGIYGSLLSTPIISPQQCAILGMHKIAKRAVVVDNQIVIRDMMYLALSYDHRIIDGKEAVSFLVQIKNWLEDPSRMLLNL